ncbi:MAG: tRNA (adenosine(37)-N6)-threonylcarbamoyltransferase complex dimerization subunit type 1 TsaB [Clostridiales bacterium]|jgi:tRNA threonylcarbamoyladenosine biosynthesis protein TsaB|nr:tRNA (adenosine(37)-N6)-threonylcarbamoyltransferase complex dimerization subunit type 1 TsaB [Clostridiales bacterium]
MKVLAFDSSGLVASVAIVNDKDLVAEYTVNYKKTHSQTLLPMLDEISKMLNLDLKEVDAIAVAEGPGSFTGLRIGSATVKGLGMVLDIPIIPVPTVDGLAYNLYKTKGVICPLMDARRNQVYTGIYKWDQDEFVVLSEQKAVGIEEIAKEINQINEEVIFLGDGVSVFEGQLKEMIKVPYTFAPPHVSKQRAGAIGALGLEMYKKGTMIDSDDFSPTYLRKSQAERELEKKKNQENQK